MAKGSLGFPTLITALCVAHRVEVNPTAKIRPAIGLEFIMHNCTEEQAPQAGDALDHHSPIHQPSSSSPSSMEALMLEQMNQMQLEQRAIWEHMQMQQSATHRGRMHLHQVAYQNGS